MTDMNNDNKKRAEELFQQAADLPEEERATFLDEQCGTDDALREEVESLLSCLDGQAVASLDAVDRLDEAELGLSGKQIGPYKLLQLLGEGGFGLVFEAEQEKPIRRRVALKVIKLGMDTKKVIVRFEAERQALALMDHPNIARVLDAGATETGRPYFVMELVRGVPITEFCDRRNLSVKQRLELFARVCLAVQHAHQKGVIHRDIKPSNVLVTLKDGVPIPKVIDFGIAKATDRKLSEETFFTDYHYFMGTPEYMSPEQVGSHGSDIDTRTDIYSLGVLLYMLITSRTPFDWKTLGRAAFGEVQRIIREEDPPTPSACVSRLGPELDTAAHTRQVTPQAFSKVVRGELDWIVMKALEKDRTRRYESAADFAADIQRFMNHEPVEAGPPGALYRIGKFVRRHRLGVLASAVTAAALIVGLALAAVGYYQAVQAKASLQIERDAAEVARASAEKSADLAQKESSKFQAVNDFMQEMLSTVDPSRAMGRDLSMHAVLQEAGVKVDEGSLTGLPEVEAEVRLTLGNTFMALGHYEEAEHHLILAEALRRVALGADDPKTLVARNQRAAALRRQAKYEESIPLIRETLEDAMRVLGPEDPQTLVIMTDLAISLSYTPEIDESEAMHRKVLAIRKRILGDDHPKTLTTLFMLGTTLWFQKDLDGAEEVLTGTLEKCLQVLGENHPDTLKVMNNLALVLDARNKEDEAEAIYRRAIINQRLVFGENHPETHRTMKNLINLLLDQAKKDQAEEVALERAASVRRAGDIPNISAGMLNDFAWFLLTSQFNSVQDPETALLFAERANAMRQGKDIDVLDTLALALTRTKDFDRATKMRKKLYELILLNGSDRLTPLDQEMRLTETLFQKLGVETKKLKSTLSPFMEKKVKAGEKSEVKIGYVLAHAARILMEDEMYAEAELFARESMSLRKTYAPKNQIYFIDSLTLLASILAKQKNYSQAESELRQALNMLANLPFKAEERRIEATEQLIRLYEQMGKPEGAEAWREKLHQ